MPHPFGKIGVGHERYTSSKTDLLTEKLPCLTLTLLSFRKEINNELTDALHYSATSQPQPGRAAGRPAAEWS